MGEGRRFAGITVWLVRVAALVIAAALVRWSGQLEEGFRAETAAEFGPDWAQWWLIQAVYLVAGMAFTVAVRFPFPRSRFAWSRLGIAALVILPAVHFWYAVGGDGGAGVLAAGLLVRLRDDGGLVDPGRCGDRGWVRRATIGR